MIQLKYGRNLENEELVMYFKTLIRKIWKMLPMKEKQEITLDKYFQSLMLEITGGNLIILDNSLFIELIFNLESILTIEEHELYKSQIFKCINICEKIIERLGDDNGIL